MESSTLIDVIKKAEHISIWITAGGKDFTFEIEKHVAMQQFKGYLGHYFSKLAQDQGIGEKWYAYYSGKCLNIHFT